MPSGRQGRNASNSAGARMGRKKQLVVCEIEEDHVYKVLGSSEHWVEFGAYRVRATPELESVWQEDRELWGLVQKSKAGPTGPDLQSFRTTGKNYFVRDTRGREYEIESILVLPGGDLLLSWKTYPAHLIRVNQNEEDDEDTLRTTIAELQAQLLEVENARDEQRLRAEELERVVDRQAAELNQLRILVQIQGEEVVEAIGPNSEQHEEVVNGEVIVPALQIQNLVNDLMDEIENAENGNQAAENELAPGVVGMEI